MPSPEDRDCGQSGPDREAGEGVVPEQAHEAQAPDHLQNRRRGLAEGRVKGRGQSVVQ